MRNIKLVILDFLSSMEVSRRNDSQAVYVKKFEVGILRLFSELGKH